jgi:hypothetical protein
MLHSQRELTRRGSNLNSAYTAWNLYRSSNNLVSSKESHNRKEGGTEMHLEEVF